MGKFLTNDEFIARAKELHQDKYDYKLVVYKGMAKKVTIICPEHGKFRQKADNHIQGQGCPKCGKKRSQDSLANICKW